jgi:hypothetical protein
MGGCTHLHASRVDRAHARLWLEDGERVEILVGDEDVLFLGRGEGLAVDAVVVAGPGGGRVDDGGGEGGGEAGAGGFGGGEGEGSEGWVRGGVRWGVIHW